MPPHLEHFQFDGCGGSAGFCSGGLVTGSTAFGICRCGIKVGHEFEEDFDGAGDGCWKDCVDSSGSSARAYAAAGGRDRCTEALYPRFWSRPGRRDDCEALPKRWAQKIHTS